MRLITNRFVLGLFLLFAGAVTMRAQSGSIYYAGGTAMDSSIGPLNTLGGGVIYNTPRMGVIFFHNLGIGGEVSFRNGRAPYAGLEYSPKFYDLNAVYQPITLARRFAPEIQAGFGRANFDFYYTPQFCLGFPQGCRSTTAQATGANYLELHVAGGVRYYAYKGFFVRPQVDVRWVDNLIFFGSPWVREYAVSIGYTLRRRK